MTKCKEWLLRHVSVNRKGNNAYNLTKIQNFYSTVLFYMYNKYYIEIV